MTVSEMRAIDEARETCVIAGSYRIDIFGSLSPMTMTTSSATPGSWYITPADVVANPAGLQIMVLLRERENPTHCAPARESTAMEIRTGI